MHQGDEHGKKSAEVMGSVFYPELNGEERREAMTNLRRYFEIVVAMAEETAHPGPGLTDSDPVPTMKERSNVDLKN